MTETASAFALNSLAVTGVALLRAVRDGGWASKAELARQAGRLEKHISRDLATYAKAGLIDDDPIALTAEGDAQLAAIERAEGGGEPGLPGGQGDILFLRHAQIVPDPANARRDWDSEDAIDDLDALRADIVENGLLQNLIVTGPVEPPADGVLGETIRAALPEGTPLYQLAGGERRWRALYSAIVHGDWDPDRRIACRLLTPEDDVQLRIAALSENLQRRDLNPIEKAHGFDGLAQAGLSNQDIADRFGKTPEHVQQHRAFLTLNEADQARLTLPRDDARRLTVRQARELVAQRNKAAAPPPEVGVAPVAQLIAAEILHAVRTRANYTWDMLEVGPDALADIHLTELVEARMIEAPAIARYGALRGRWGLRVAHNFPFAAFPDMHGSDAEALDAALAAERDRLAQIAGAPVRPEGDAPYTTAWLNAPFDITPEGQALIDEQDAAQAEETRQREEATQQREAVRQAHAVVAARARDLFEAARTATAGGRVDATVVTSIATDAESPLPWRVSLDGGVVAADGSPVIGGGGSDRGEARMRLLVLAVNAAAGLETPEDEQPEPNPEDDPDPDEVDGAGDEEEGE